MNDKFTRQIYLEACLTAILMGMGIVIIFPRLALTGYVIGGFGVLGVVFYIYTHSKYDILFRNLKLTVGEAQPILKRTEHTDYSTIRHFTLPAGLCLQDFLDNQEAIENYINRQVKISYHYKEIIIEEYHSALKTDYPYQITTIKGYVPIIVGYDRTGQLITCDLGSGEPHMLIGGETGGGKSTALRCMLTNLILTTNVKLHLVDLKNGVELRLFDRCKNTESFCRNINAAVELLRTLEMEVDNRYDLFYKYNVKDIEAYNNKFKKKLDYQLLVIDEFADLQECKEAKQILDRLGRKARACGIHMILSTQRPSMKVLEGDLKANIPVILGLKTQNQTSSRVVIDEIGLEKLRGKGHALFKHNGEIIELQCPFIDYEQAEKLISHTYVTKVRNKISENKEEITL